MRAAEERAAHVSGVPQGASPRARRAPADAGIDAVMNRLRLDAIVAPTGSPAWPIDLVNGDHFLGASSTPSAVAGYPSVTVPAGFVNGLPVGLSFMGRAVERGDAHQPRICVRAGARAGASRRSFSVSVAQP